MCTTLEEILRHITSLAFTLLSTKPDLLQLKGNSTDFVEHVEYVER